MFFCNGRYPKTWVSILKWCNCRWMGVFSLRISIMRLTKKNFWSSCTIRGSSCHIRASRMFFQRELSGSSPVVCWLDSQPCIEKAPLKKRVETRTQEGNEVKPIRQIVLTSKTVWPDQTKASMTRPRLNGSDVVAFVVSPFCQTVARLGW